jgi:hypothetical protein
MLENDPHFELKEISQGSLPVIYIIINENRRTSLQNKIPFIAFITIPVQHNDIYFIEEDIKNT